MRLTSSIVFSFLLFLTSLPLFAATPEENVEKVYVVFKTHLDVGFTDLSSTVTEKYIHNFIPKALDVAERLREEKSPERYVWTTGAWLIDEYLRCAPTSRCGTKAPSPTDSISPSSTENLW